MSVRVTRREALRRAVLGGLGLAVGALTACDVAAPPPTPRPIPTPVRKAVEPTPPPPSPVPEAGGPVARILLEAEDFVPAGAAPGTNPGQGWRPIGVGQGNYMVDSIGASHVSGESLLFARAEDVGARAYLDTSVPKAGQYRLLARYEYPARELHARIAVSVEQSGRAPARVELGAPGATRGWFFNLEDGPWHEQPHGVEGLVVEGGHAGPGGRIGEVRAGGAGGIGAGGEPLPGPAAPDERPGGHVQDREAPGRIRSWTRSGWRRPGGCSCGSRTRPTAARASTWRGSTR